MKNLIRRAFHLAGAYGRFAIQSCNRSFQRACTKADVRGLHLYDLRHSFGAQLYRVTGDLATVQRFLIHASPSFGLSSVKRRDTSARSFHLGAHLVAMGG